MNRERKRRQLNRRPIPTSVPDTGPSRNSSELEPFVEWLKVLPPQRLHWLLQDALWKNQIQETELYRMFLLEHYGKIRMIQR